MLKMMVECDLCDARAPAEERTFPADDGQKWDLPTGWKRLGHRHDTHHACPRCAARVSSENRRRYGTDFARRHRTARHGLSENGTPGKTD